MALTPNTIIAAVFIFLMLYASITDVKTLRIPNWISIATIALFGIFLLVGGKTLVIWQHLAVAAVVLVIGFGVYSFGYMGAGDIKLMSAVALWAGPLHVLDFLLFMSLFGAALALIVLGGKRYLLWDKEGWSPSQWSRFFPAWVRRGLLPYGVAISLAALMSIPSVIL